MSSINLAEDDEIDKGDNDNAEDIHHHAMEISGLPVTEDESLPDIVEQSTEISSDTQHIYLTLHRGHLLHELINAIKNIDPTLTTVAIQIVMPGGGLEAAKDGGGVTRDALAEFGQHFTTSVLWVQNSKYHIYDMILLKKSGWR